MEEVILNSNSVTEDLVNSDNPNRNLVSFQNLSSDYEKLFGMFMQMATWMRQMEDLRLKSGKKDPGGSYENDEMYHKLKTLDPTTATILATFLQDPTRAKQLVTLINERPTPQSRPN